MALLAMCLEAGISCAAAHVNYHHRPEAEEEEASVRAFCRDRGIACYVKNDPFEWEGNFEAAAREYRYAFFAKLVKAHGFKGVLIAHHQDDLLETYFMQEEKGIIPDYYGLREERMIQGVLVKRPLLSMRKAQLIEYCETHGIRTFNDSTNADTSLTRNRIRHETVAGLTPFERDMVLREIRRKNAALKEKRCRIGAMIQNGAVSLGNYRSLQKEDRLEVLRQLLGERGIRYGKAGCLELDQIIVSKPDFEIPLGAMELVQKEGFFFVHVPEEPYEYHFADLQELKQAESAYFRVEEGVPGVNALTIQDSDWPLTIRSVRDGDAISLRFGTKPVHRFFIDRHIPRFERKTWPVVTDREGALILVPGLGCDTRHYSLSPQVSVLQYSTYLFNK